MHDVTHIRNTYEVSLIDALVNGRHPEESKRHVDAPLRWKPLAHTRHILTDVVVNTRYTERHRVVVPERAFDTACQHTKDCTTCHNVPSHLYILHVLYSFCQLKYMYNETQNTTGTK